MEATNFYRCRVYAPSQPPEDLDCDEFDQPPEKKICICQFVYCSSWTSVELSYAAARRLGEDRGTVECLICPCLTGNGVI